jgi:hypothetical protein
MNGEVVGTFYVLLFLLPLPPLHVSPLPLAPIQATSSESAFYFPSMYEIPYSKSGKFMTPVKDNTESRNGRKLSIPQFVKKILLLRLSQKY